jgi:hypothetical protein
VPPERPEVHLQLDARGAALGVWAMRWDDGARGPRGSLPCGGVVHVERRCGDLVLPSRLTAGRWFGPPRWSPYFEAEVLAARAAAGRAGPGERGRETEPVHR